MFLHLVLPPSFSTLTGRSSLGVISMIMNEFAGRSKGSFRTQWSSWSSWKFWRTRKAWILLALSSSQNSPWILEWNRQFTVVTLDSIKFISFNLNFQEHLQDAMNLSESASLFSDHTDKKKSNFMALIFSNIFNTISFALKKTIITKKLRLQFSEFIDVTEFSVFTVFSVSCCCFCAAGFSSI